MRKKTLYAVHIVAILLVISLRALGQDDQSVKIIHFGVGNADCTLIVIKDLDMSSTPVSRTVTILIDAGGSSVYSSSQNKNTQAKGKGKGKTKPKPKPPPPPQPTGTADQLWEQIWERITAEGANRLDYLVISHLHADHVGNASTFLRIIGQEAKYASWRGNLAIIDRRAFHTGKSNKDPKVREYKPWRVTSENHNTKYNTEYTKYFGRSRGKDPQRRFLFYGQDLLSINRRFTLRNTEMICVASDGVIGDTRKANGARNVPSNENDIGFAFLLRFGSFRYFTGGDLGYQSPYTNMEKPLSEQVENEWKTMHGATEPFHVCALKVNHHGSEKSTSDDFVRVFNPKVAVFSAGLKSFGTGTKFHPTEEAITKLGGNTPMSGNINTPPSRQLLFTFQLNVGTEDDADPMKNFPKYTQWDKVGQDGVPQDVILYVRKEDARTPLKDLPPKIYMYRMPREKTTYQPIPPPASAPTTDPPPTLSEFAYAPFFVVCDRLDANRKHESLELPSRNPLIPVKDFKLLSQLRFFIQP